MSRELIAAQSGWGKSWVAQHRIESNLDAFDHVLVLDYCDEYRGLAKAGLGKWLGVGQVEASLSVDGWARLMQSNGVVIAARAVGADTWRETVAERVALAAQQIDGDVLIVLDEAHFIARNAKSTPEQVQELATTGRGQGIATIWITQRIAKLDTTVSSQCDRRLLGGFQSPRDVDRVDDLVDYNGDLHEIGEGTVRGVPDELGSEAVQETEPGSEWVYSTRSGEKKRLDSSEMSMRSTHYGPEGSQLSIPE